MDFLTTIFFAIIGGHIATRFKIPAGAMIGSMFSVTIFNVLTGMGTMPIEFKILTQIATGTFIGARIHKDDVLGLNQVIKPAILLISSMVVLNFILGYILYANSSLDLVTALFSTAPGGMMDMTLIANDMKADSAKVVVFQLVRLVSVISIIPIFLKFLIKREGISLDVAYDNEPIKAAKKITTTKDIVFTVIIGIISGLIGYFLKVPAGALSFSMIGVGVFNIFTANAFMPVKFRQIVQMFGGALIGTKIFIQDIIEMQELLPFVFLIIFGFAFMNIIIGMLLYKATNFSISTALFSAAPGGASDISIIASEMGADTPKVAILQLSRLIFIISFYPFLIQIFVDFFQK